MTTISIFWFLIFPFVGRFFNAILQEKLRFVEVCFCCVLIAAGVQSFIIFDEESTYTRRKLIVTTGRRLWNKSGLLKSWIELIMANFKNLGFMAFFYGGTWGNVNSWQPCRFLRLFWWNNRFHNACISASYIFYSTIRYLISPAPDCIVI